METASRMNRRSCILQAAGSRGKRRRGLSMTQGDGLQAWKTAAVGRRAMVLTAGAGSQLSAMQRADGKSMPMTRQAISRRRWMPEAGRSAMPTTAGGRSVPSRTRAGIQRPSGMTGKADTAHRPQGHSYGDEV